MGSHKHALVRCSLLICFIAICHETARAAPVSRPRTLALEEFFNNLDADRNGQVDAKEASAFIANLGGSEYDEPKEVAQGVEAFLQVGVPEVAPASRYPHKEPEECCHTPYPRLQLC